MIKKTFETLKQNPIIILILSIPFIYTVIDSFIPSGISFREDPVLWAESLKQPLVLLGWLFSVVYTVGSAVFLYPVVSRYIYLTVSDLPRDRWYKKCFRGFWWRNIALGLIFGLILAAIMILIAIIAFVLLYIFSIFIPPAIYFIFFGVSAVVVSTMGMIATAAIFAEDDFSKGLSNIFKAWKKCFWDLLPFALISILPIAFVIIRSLNTVGYSLGNRDSLIITFFTVVFGIFTSVYAMHCYVEYKAEHLEQVDGEIEQTKVNDGAQLEA